MFRRWNTILTLGTVVGPIGIKYSTTLLYKHILKFMLSRRSHHVNHVAHLFGIRPVSFIDVGMKFIEPHPKQVTKIISSFFGGGVVRRSGPPLTRLSNDETFRLFKSDATFAEKQSDFIIHLI